MSFGNWMRSAVLGLALTGLATAAEATVFKLDSLTFSGSALSDPGLVVKTNPLAPIEFTLDGVGDSQVVSLFEIWSEETAVNLEDDIESRSLSMSLQFSLPAPPFNGSVPGETDGGFPIWFIIWLAVPNPTLDWDEPVVFNFGPKGDGALQLTMFDTGFEYGCQETVQVFTFGGHHDNSCRTTVKGKFKLLANATEVPEPATLAVLGLGLGALGVFGMRRRRAA